MEAYSHNLFNIRAVIIFHPVPTMESILREVFRKFIFLNKSGLLQFWACCSVPDSEETRCNLVLTGLTCNPTQDHELEDYRNACLENHYPCVGREINVGNWLVGRAAQTGIADHRTTHHVLDQEDQHSRDVGDRGQLVLPVFINEGAGIKLVGIIDYLDLYVLIIPMPLFSEFLTVIIFHPVPTMESILREVFRKFIFLNKSGLLQFWACCSVPDSEETRCNLVLTGLTCNPTQDHELEDYRNACLENHYPCVGREINVGNWLVGRAAQTGIADHRTTHHVLDQEDQHSRDVGDRGQVVLPVFINEGAGNKLVGIIEYITSERKESYIQDFEQIHNILQDAGLKSTYMGKTIKVVYNGNMIRFTLPLSANFSDLHTEVTMRFMELQHQIYHVEYYNTEGIRLSISSDDTLRICMAESSSRGAKFIKMFVSVEQGE
ncbi:hypothetical protein E3N88_30898 [Mikania micrantha]|uniref:PB1 domain-containing protein n=1 Tax=Mikania micrantha TaxID=192012 RepID=A0A5N6MQX1_9ASTR|nr:hypothetical protein E3N88_30898 [Mikania micrantha]